jgi:NAD(P)-dependent dehydrogenase (short-subunit alcohol dehydrogenase family)
MTPAEKTILISGCSSGIGRCAALGLHARGYRVFAGARRADDLAELRCAGLETVQLDMDDSTSLQQAVAGVLQQTSGQLYALFNNAGFGQAGAVEDLSRDALRAQFETNLFGLQELTNLVIPVMRRQGYGRIVQNSSVLGLVALAYRGAYSASKFALEALSDTLRLELAGSGIHVSLIEPGPIASRFREHSLAAFRRHVNAEASVHRAAYAAQIRRLSKPGAAAPFTLPPEAVLAKLIHALESPRPRARYPVTVPSHLFAFLRRLLSARALDRLMRRVSGGGAR